MNKQKKKRKRIKTIKHVYSTSKKIVEKLSINNQTKVTK